jgi:glycosyltransferase involved in cell wall biosynthesis
MPTPSVQTLSTQPATRNYSSDPPDAARGPISVLHCVWHGQTGGAERSVYLLARAQMRDPDVAPALLFAQGRGPYWELAQELGCPVFSLDMPNSRSLRHIKRATEVMQDFSVHHFHSAEPPLMIASARCTGSRRVYTHRGGGTLYPMRQALRYRATGFIVRRSFAGFTGNSVHAVASASSLLGVPEWRFAVTYNGLDFGLLEPTRSVADVRADLGVSTDEFVVGTSANVRPWKRIDRLIRAAHRMQRADVRVLILGDGPDMPRLREVTKALDFESQVIFAGMHPQVGNYLQVMDAFCLPSDWQESFGNAAVEALGMGLPTVVFSDSPGLAEHIDSGRTGFVVGDEAELRDRLSELADDRELARSLGEAGRAEVRARYGMEGGAANYRRLYQTLLGRSAPV